MNILIVTQYFHPERFIITGVAEDLSRAGHSVTVLTGMPNYPGGKLFPGYRRTWLKHEFHDGVEIIRVPLVPRGAASSFRLLINYLSFALSASLLAPFLITKKVDVILVYMPSPVTVGIPALVMKWLKSAPILFWVQDLWPESLVATGAIRSPRLLRIVRRGVRFLYRGAELILIQSMAFRPKIRELGGDKIRFLPNPADRCNHPISPSADAPEGALMRRGFRVLWAGNMGTAQDLGNILAAAERLKHRREIQWILVGGGRLRNWVEEQVSARQLEPTVQVIGPFPAERMPRFFALADVLTVALRREEAFALTIPSRLQSFLACGRPIVAALDGEGARIVEEARAGLTCPPSDHASLAAAIERLYAMPAAERNAMGNAGRRYFEQEYDREMLIGRLQGFLEEARRTCP